MKNIDSEARTCPTYVIKWANTSDSWMPGRSKTVAGGFLEHSPVYLVKSPPDPTAWRWFEARDSPQAHECATKVSPNTVLVHTRQIAAKQGDGVPLLRSRNIDLHAKLRKNGMFGYVLRVFTISPSFPAPKT